MNDFLYPLIFLVALVYSSVGHGGASGYLAVLALCGFSPQEMAPSALTLNLLVAGTAFWAFWRNGFFSWRLFWPFALSSIPMAFVGGFIAVPPFIYGWLLMISLLFAALRLVFVQKHGSSAVCEIPALNVALLVGASVGLLSGMVGVGGGIFLSPLLILMRWADAKQTAAMSACFIWVNSASGLIGHVSRGGFQAFNMWPLVVAAFLGGLLGSQLGARTFNRVALCRVLALVLAMAAFKMFVLAVQG